MRRFSGVLVLLAVAALCGCAGNRIFSPAPPGAPPLGSSGPDLSSGGNVRPPVNGMGNGMGQ